MRSTFAAEVHLEAALLLCEVCLCFRRSWWVFEEESEELELEELLLLLLLDALLDQAIISFYEKRLPL